MVNVALAVQVNLPSSLKMTRPRIQLAGEGTESPLPVAKPSKGTEVIVVAGEVRKGNCRLSSCWPRHALAISSRNSIIKCCWEHGRYHGLLYLHASHR